MMSSIKPLRSLLFVPAANPRFLESALTKPCDGVILDLEDGTHPDLKPSARAGLPEALKRLKAANKLCAVRINSSWLAAATDVTAAVGPDLDLLVVPKVEHPRDLQLLSSAVGELEQQAGVRPGQVKFLLQIESAAALPRLHDLARASERNLAMMLGSEDFSLDMGGMPTADALYVPSMMVLQAARAAGIQAMGFIASIAALGEPEAFKPVLARARELGFRGAVIVHPKYLDLVNQCFTPSAAQLQEAQAVVTAFEAAFARGEGAIRLGELMVDKPVYQRALTLLGEWPSIEP